MAEDRGEQAVLRWLARRLPAAPAGQTWVGDDAAVVEAPPAGAPLLLAADLVVEGVHSDPRLCSVADLGWKALAVNLSDLAAMGGRPLHALVSVAGPPETDLAALYEGLLDASAAYGCPVVGGDLAACPTLVVSVAVTGTLAGGGPGPVTRSGAAAGDSVFVSGPLGRSAAGLRVLQRGASAEEAGLALAHRRPTPRLGEGEAARKAGATAMIDVSDGLSLDLWRMADASGVGVELERVPVAAGATVSDALAGGEDYELVFCAPDADRVRRAFAEGGLAAPILVGRCTPDKGRLRWEGRELEPAGYSHPWRAP